MLSSVTVLIHILHLKITGITRLIIFMLGFLNDMFIQKMNMIDHNLALENLKLADILKCRLTLNTYPCVPFNSRRKNKQ